MGGDFNEVTAIEYKLEAVCCAFSTSSTSNNDLILSWAAVVDGDTSERGNHVVLILFNVTIFKLGSTKNYVSEKLLKMPIIQTIQIKKMIVQVITMKLLINQLVMQQVLIQKFATVWNVASMKTTLDKYEHVSVVHKEYKKGIGFSFGVLVTNTDQAVVEHSLQANILSADATSCETIATRIPLVLLDMYDYPCAKATTVD